MGRFSPGDSGRGDYFWGDSEPHPVAGSKVGRSTDYAIEPVMGIVLLWSVIYLICRSLVM